MRNLTIATASALISLGLATQAPASENTSEPVARYKATFSQLDGDGDRTHSRDEALSAGLRGEGFARLDTNGDRVLDLDEFLVLAAEAQSRPPLSGTTDSDHQE